MNTPLNRKWASTREFKRQTGPAWRCRIRTNERTGEHIWLNERTFVSFKVIMLLRKDTQELTTMDGASCRRRRRCVAPPLLVSEAINIAKQSFSVDRMFLQVGKKPLEKEKKNQPNRNSLNTWQHLGSRNRNICSVCLMLPEKPCVLCICCSVVKNVIYPYVWLFYEGVFFVFLFL